MNVTIIKTTDVVDAEGRMKDDFVINLLLLLNFV